MANGLSLWDKPKADKFIRNDAGPGDARLTACARLNAMQELLTRTWDMLVGREHGPLAFRLVIQPMAGAFLAIRAGVKDAREGRPPHGWAILTDPIHRRELLRESWHDVARLFIVAVIIDMIYEVIVFRWIYPGQALIVALIVALPSYLLVRGPANRLARLWLRLKKQPRLRDDG
jgi:hypothetical protein